MYCRSCYYCSFFLILIGKITGFRIVPLHIWRMTPSLDAEKRSAGRVKRTCRRAELQKWLTLEHPNHDESAFLEIKLTMDNY